jgi:diphosphomevalonate decarboxylase
MVSFTAIDPVKTATARADSNIALIKYWGKLDPALNLPAVSSLSMTLDGLETTTSVSLSNSKTDTFTLNGIPQHGDRLDRVTRFLDLIRQLAQRKERVHIESVNQVPTAAGLASSASGFAALCVAGCKVFGLELDAKSQSSLARRGSASAARSLFGPFATLPKGVAGVTPGEKMIAHETCSASAIEPHSSLHLGMVIAVCSKEEKKISSTAGMALSAESSPFYKAWVESHDADMEQALQAITGGDFHLLGECMEHSTLKMHACMMASNPPLLYWNSNTLLAMDRVKQLRDENGERLAYFTMDAGPHVKALCRLQHMQAVENALRELSGLTAIISARPGRGANLL